MTAKQKTFIQRTRQISGATTIITDPPYESFCYQTGNDTWLWYVHLLDAFTGERSVTVGHGETNCELAARRSADAVLAQFIGRFWQHSDGTKVPIPKSKEDIAHAGYLQRWTEFLHQAMQTQAFSRFVAQSFTEWLDEQKATIEEKKRRYLPL